MRGFPYRYLVISFALLLQLTLCAQKAPIENSRYKKEDKAKVAAMSKALENSDSATFFKLYTSYLTEAKKNKNYFLWSYCYDKRAIFSYYRTETAIALAYYDSALLIAEPNDLKDVTSGLYMNKGAISFTGRKYSQALKNFKKAEALMLETKSPRIGGLLGNISLLYQELGDLENAKKYIHRAIPFAKLDKAEDSYAKSLNNLGLIYKKERNYKAADSLFRIGYAFTKEKKLHADFADVCYNLVELLSIQGKYAEAKPFNEELLEHVKKYKDASWVKLVILDQARIYYNLNDLAMAKKYIAMAEAVPLPANILDREKLDFLSTFGELYLNLRLFEKSARAYNEYYNLDQKNSQQSAIIELQQLSYKYEKEQDSLANAKEKELAELVSIREQEKAEHRLQQQRIVTGVSLVGICFVIVFLVFLIKANRNKEKANKEISLQKGLLAEKNKEITDSITYAQRIQQSLLPPKDLLDILLPNHFLLYMPKDIVSGDFFWAKKINTHELFVAVADCTGHGVPGAMMSALSIQNLNELSGQTRSPGELLSLLNTNLKNTLNQDQEGFSKDGLDICLCKINMKERKITYSGANRNLNIVNQQGLKAELKATKTGIGGHTDVKQVYEETTLTVDENDMIVMSTDGFADQFGGPDGKKITTKRFKQWLTDIVLLDNKKSELMNRFNAWRGTGDQIDDVCVMGFKI